MATFWSLLWRMTKEKPLGPCRKGKLFWQTQDSLAQPFKPSRVYRMKSGVQQGKTLPNISTMYFNVLRVFLGALDVLNTVLQWLQDTLRLQWSLMVFQSCIISIKQSSDFCFNGLHLEAKVEKTDIFCSGMLCLPEMLMNLHHPCTAHFLTFLGF